jgi:uncharacterized repeat protein (TIGR03803 family)
MSGVIRKLKTLPVLLVASASVWLSAAQAGTFAVLHAFHGGNDGASPFATLIPDGSGKFLGTAEGGGNSGCYEGCGTVFRLAPDGRNTTLYAFAGGSDGYYPFGGVLTDSAGNLYGTTYQGGDYDYGTVFKIDSSGTKTILHSFSGEDLGENDGVYPEAGLISDSAGNLYGTTTIGGSASYGDVFRIANDGTESILYSFKGSNHNDGAYPGGRLFLDKKGDIFGSTLGGGAPACGGDEGCGTIFKLAPDGTESVLYAFTGGNDGANPAASLVVDSSGNFYGTAEKRGDRGNGVVFKLTPGGGETVLHAVAGGRDGALPGSDLVWNGSALLGTTSLGGGSGTGCGREGCGTVFTIASDGTETVLYRFNGPKDGGDPTAGLTAAGNQVFVGAAPSYGRKGYGTIFRIGSK